MSEFLGMSVTDAAAAATVVGYVGGRFVNRLADNHAYQTEVKVISDWGPIEGLPQAEVAPAYQGSRLRRLIGNGLAPIALTGAVAVGLLPMALTSGQAPRQPGAVEPTLEVGVDRAGQELSDGTAIKVDEVLGAFNTERNFHLNFVVARGGDDAYVATHPTLSEVEHSTSLAPGGSVSLPTAANYLFTNALSYAMTSESNAIGSSNEASSTILFIDDDNELGPVSDPVSDPVSIANQDKEHIDIADVGPEKDQTADDLNQIAVDTGGHYWNVSHNTAKQAQKIEKAIDPAGIPMPKPLNGKPNIWLDVLDGIAFVGLAETTRRQAKLRFEGKRS